MSRFGGARRRGDVAADLWSEYIGPEFQDSVSLRTATDKAIQEVDNSKRVGTLRSLLVRITCKYAALIQKFQEGIDHVSVFKLFLHVCGRR